MPPTTNNLFAGNGRIRYRTKQYLTWKKEAGQILAVQRPAKLLGEVSIMIEVGEPKTKRQMDLANREKASIDLLVEHGVIEGDSQRYLRRIIMQWANIDGIRLSVKPWNGGSSSVEEF